MVAASKYSPRSYASSASLSLGPLHDARDITIDASNKPTVIYIIRFMKLLYYFIINE